MHRFNRFYLLCSIVFSTVIKSSTIIHFQGALLALMDDEMSPHSFFKYIFINKGDFEKGAIEKEIIRHEMTHVRQIMMTKSTPLAVRVL